MAGTRACSDVLTSTTGSIAVTEGQQDNWMLKAMALEGSGTLTPSGRTANVSGLSTSSGSPTLIIFTNVYTPGTVTLTLCKIGQYINPADRYFTFNLTSAAGSQQVQLQAPTAAPGDCKTLTYLAGTRVRIAENVPGWEPMGQGYWQLTIVKAISVMPGSSTVEGSMQTGMSGNQAVGQVDVTLNSNTTVTFLNWDPYGRGRRPHSGMQEE